jgi:hypothetical protein
MTRRIALVAVLLLAAVSSAAMCRAPVDDTTEWQQVLRAFNIRTVEGVPPGIRPLEVQTPAQLRELLSLRARESYVVTESQLGAATSLSYGIVESCVSLHTSRSWVPFPTFNLWADVWIVGSGSFWEIGDVFEWVGLTGITLFADLTSEWHYHIVSADHQSVIIKGGGTVNHYFLIKGLIRVYSQPVSLTLSYSLP